MENVKKKSENWGKHQRLPVKTNNKKQSNVGELFSASTLID